MTPGRLESIQRKCKTTEGISTREKSSHFCQTTITLEVIRNAVGQETKPRRLVKKLMTYPR